MSDDRLFDLSEVPEVPLFREPPPGRGAQIMDERIGHDYPPEWHKCTTCEGRGRVWGERTERADGVADGEVVQVEFEVGESSFVMTALREMQGGRVEMFAGDVGTYVGFRRRDKVCPDCLGMGSVKARVRLEAGHRCVRCQHPFMPKGDAKMLGVEPSGGRWSACESSCRHGGPFRTKMPDSTWQIPEYEDGGASEFNKWQIHEDVRDVARIMQLIENGWRVEAEWRILTVHHLDGDKANLRWWNLLACCQTCHLHLQHKIVMERVYPHPHSEWFVPYVCGYYAWAYLGQEITRDEAVARRDELLALELDSSYVS